MSEVQRIPGVLSFDLGYLVADALIERGDFPSDFYLRALSLPKEERDQIVSQDILAATGLGAPSVESQTYLEGPLPDCIFVPGTESLFKILRTTAEDYHRLHDLREIADKRGVKDEYTWLIWEELIGHLSPTIHQLILGFRKPERRGERFTFGRRSQISYVVARTVIKDTAIMSLYDEPPRGMGPMRRGLLRELLADNHPELA